MRIRVINPTITTSWEQDSLDAYRLAASPGTEMSITTLQHGTVSLESHRDLAVVIPGIIAEAAGAEDEGFDGVIVDCMLDPGVRQARELVSIPVFGPAEPTMHLAATLGHRYSVLTVLESLIPLVEEQTERYGVASRLASVRSLEIPVLELEDDMDRTLAVAVDVSERAVRQDGAHVVIPGCTSLAGKAHFIQAGLAARGLDVTVIDPPSVATRTVESVISMGLSHSKRTYPTRPPKPFNWPGLRLGPSERVKR